MESIGSEPLFQRARARASEVLSVESGLVVLRLRVSRMEGSGRIDHSSSLRLQGWLVGLMDLLKEEKQASVGAMRRIKSVVSEFVC